MPMCLAILIYFCSKDDLIPGKSCFEHMMRGKEQRRLLCIGALWASTTLSSSLLPVLSIAMTVRSNCSASSFHYIENSSCYIILESILNLLCNTFFKIWLSRQWELLSLFYRWDYWNPETRCKLTKVTQESNGRARTQT